MADPNPAIQLPDIKDFEDDLKELRPAGPGAVSDVARRPLDDVSVHDFAFHEYLLATQDDPLNYDVTISNEGENYLNQLYTRLQQQGLPLNFQKRYFPERISFCADAEGGVMQAIKDYCHESHLQQINNIWQQALDALYAQVVIIQTTDVEVTDLGMDQLISAASAFLDAASYV
jgi:hypothetical protein